MKIKFRPDNIPCQHCNKYEVIKVDNDEYIYYCNRLKKQLFITLKCYVQRLEDIK